MRGAGACGSERSGSSRSIITLLAGASILTGCSLTAPPPPVPAPTQAQIERMTFHEILEQPITLEGGSYEGAPFVDGGASRPSVRMWTDLIAFGDLDGIPGDEAAVLLSSTSGGSGERIHLSAVGMREGEAAELGTVLVGDRVEVRDLAIDGGRIVLDVVEAGPSDAACCPTRLARKTYVLDEGDVRLESSVAEGVLSLEVLRGAWTLTWIDQQPPPSDLKPPTLEVHGPRLSGYSGCNQYTGSFEEKGPGEVKITPLAGTRMACPPTSMNLEQEFLRRLERVERYTFLAGRLALSGPSGSDFLLLFEKR